MKTILIGFILIPLISASWLRTIQQGLLGCRLEQHVLSTTDGSVDEDDQHVAPFFESAEHEFIGDRVTLYYDSVNITGANFNYSVSGTNIQLSYGLVIALAGDFYANWTTSSGCAVQISDFWKTNQSAAVESVVEMGGWLATNKWNYLPCILKYMNEQRKDVLDAVKNGKDPAQVYDSISSYYDTRYAYCTNSGYVWIAECNWDHFGYDAEDAYRAGHLAALQQAQLAYSTGNASALRQAYFLEAFASHYLTDLFAAGHLRTPRRVLHRNFWGDIPENPEIPDLYPADLCAQKMHNEDNANGLWVTNAKGESWTTYGDKQLFTEKGAQTARMAIRAAQSGVDEVWKTYNTGQVPNIGDFEALKRTPNIQDILGGPSLNFFPLFDYFAHNPPGQRLWMRSALDNRVNTSFLAVPVEESFFEWKKKLSRIQESGEDIYMYPYTRPFASTTDMVQIRTPVYGDPVISKYGLVEVEIPGGQRNRSWGMREQAVMRFENTWPNQVYISVNRLGGSNGVYSSVIRLLDDNGVPTLSRHTGLNLSDYSIIWDDVFNETNAFWEEGETTYGVFCNDSSDIAMLKYWYAPENNEDAYGRVEVYTIPADLQTAPQGQYQDWDIAAPLNFMLSYPFSKTGSALLAYGYDASKKLTTWYATQWTNGYYTQTVAQYVEDVRFPAQALLDGVLQPSNSAQPSLIRLFYGQRYTPQSNIRIDVLVPSLSSGEQLSFSQNTTQSFPVTWSGGPSTSDSYLLWFLADVDGDGVLDLVTLVNPTSMLNVQFSVVVFPGIAANNSFGRPVVSNIALDTAKGTLLTASFMSHVKAHQADYVYTDESNQAAADQGGPLNSKAGILAVFDNYGIMGVRMLAPVKATGSFKYEFKGQIPAVAG